jgi:DNA-binding MarR family transcriptional regulator
MPKGLQEEIKQTVPFKRLSSEAILSIVRTAAILDHELNDALRPFGVTSTQYNVLRILKGAGPDGLCGRDVGERMIAKVPDVPRLLERMESMGLITRERDPEDRRHVTARIAGKGIDLTKRIMSELDAFETARMGMLSDTEMRALIDGLAQIRNAR